MRVLRGLSGRALLCGCLVGTYETYDGRVVTVIDERAANCGNPRHKNGAAIGDSCDPPAATSLSVPRELAD